MSKTLVVAGASGALGRAVCAEAAARGWTVRALVRDPSRAPAGVAVVQADVRDPVATGRALAGADSVFSCVGASVLPMLGHGWRGFGAVDWPANRALIDAARTAGVRRLTYVSVFHEPAMRSLAYVDAHERVVDYLRASGLAFAVVRPTGFFSALTSYVDMARKGPIPELDGGAARSNPIADEDLAAACADAVDAGDPALELACGGPQVLSRREIAEAAFAALGRQPRLRRAPAWLLAGAAALARPFHPRISQMMRFVVAISTRDLVAPARGTRRLADALAAHARAAG